jgi:signal transduction histidine kinase
MQERDKEFLTLLASQGELVGSLSHDLKGLMSGINGGLYLVDSGTKKGKPDRVSQGYEMVKRNLARMQRAVGNMLYYVKDREIDWQPLELKGAVAAVEKALSSHAEQLGVALRVEAKDGSIECGELAVQALLCNIVEYALESCNIAKAKPSPMVTLMAERKEPHAEFHILADGFTMDEEALELSMGPHYAPRGQDRSHLALYIANKLAKAHQGSLEIQSDPGEQATRFRITLSLTKPA